MMPVTDLAVVSVLYRDVANRCGGRGVGGGGVGHRGHAAAVGHSRGELKVPQMSPLTEGVAVNSTVSLPTIGPAAPSFTVASMATVVCPVGRDSYWERP